MPKLTWGDLGERYFEVGVDRGVLYPRNGDGVSWSGLIAVNETPNGGTSKPFYMDGIKYQDRAAPEEFAATIEAYTYPKEFSRCDGTESIAAGLFVTQQHRQPFSLSYRTKIGNDLDGQDHGYKLHIVYNAKAEPSQRNNQSLRDTPEAITFSWNLTTIPERIVGVRPSAHLILDSTITAPSVMTAVEDILYGSPSTVARLLTPAELVEIYLLEAPELPFVVGTPNANGVFTISGPSSMITLTTPNTFQLNTTFATDNGDGSYTVTSE